VAHTLDNASKDFRIWSGNDNDTFHIMALGGYGTIGVATHLVGKQIKQMMDNILNSKIAEAAAIHRHLLPLVDVLFIEPNPAPTKYALNHLGFNVGKPRLPLVEPSEKSAAQIRETLKKYRIDLPV
jgi:4-hydroxy-tetrahydrodipicolinate synthase